MSLRQKKILVCVSGSIAAYRVCDLIGSLRDEGAMVTCAMTRSATKFITPLTLRSLAQGEVYTNQFAPFPGVLHTRLADESDLIVVMPASAHLIARLAAGMADDLVTSTILATGAKILIVPAMNDNMYRHSLTQENLSRLKKIGYQFVDPVKGPLVCGREEIGHIAPLDAVMDRIRSLLARKA